MLRVIVSFLLVIKLPLMGCGTEVGNGNRVEDHKKLPDGLAENSKGPSDSLVEDAVIARDENPFLGVEGETALLDLIPRLFMNGCAAPFTSEATELSLWRVEAAIENPNLLGRHLWLRREHTKWHLSFLDASEQATAKTYTYDQVENSIVVRSEDGETEIQPAVCQEIKGAKGEVIDMMKDITMDDDVTWLQSWSYLENGALLNSLEFRERNEAGKLLEGRIRLERVER